jgi:membrane protein
VNSSRQDAGSFALLVARESLRSFGANRNLEIAATLAYYGFLSLMPLLLLVIFVLGLFLQSADAMASMAGLLRDFFPTFNEAILVDLQKLASTKVWGAVSVVLLVWSMTPFAGAIRSALFQIFKSDRKIHFMKAKLVDVSAVLMLLVLMVGMAAGRVYMTALNFAAVQVPLLSQALSVVVPFVLTAGVIALFYVVFAPVRLRRGPLIAGAATTAVLLSVIRPVFGLVLQFNPNYGYAFGSLKAIFLLIVWVYYTFAVVLLGAEVMANASRKEALLLRGLFLGTLPRGGAERLVERFVRTLADGEALFREGEEGHEMFYVASGSVTLTKGDPPASPGEARRASLVLRVMNTGDYFGEMSMLTGAARTASATASAPDSRVVAISQDNFDTILRENPAIVRSILKEMAMRLQKTSELVKM